MKQVENLSIDETIQALQENELGFLLLQGKPPNMYSILSEQVSDSEHSCLIGTFSVPIVLLQSTDRRNR